jgi:hydroxyethylthiazole kinase-like uncharacterized protein yjeF
LNLLPEACVGAAVLVIAGPGNNGGDALETAYGLARKGIQVTVLLCVDEGNQPPDAQLALARAKSSSVLFADSSLIPNVGSDRWALVIDGLFGIGLARPITSAQRNLIENINMLTCPVLALDIPSGLNADTGAIIGTEGIAVQASHTITFIADKPGLHTGHGRDYAGQVQVADIGIEPEYLDEPRARLNDVKLFAHAIRKRLHNTHKGSYGDTAIIGGASGMQGALVLAARAAMQCGAGRVFAGFVDQAPAYDCIQPELMFRIAHELDFSKPTLVVGPGLGTSARARELLGRALDTTMPLVLDADGLNLIAAEPALKQKLAFREAATLLTPHPLEAARLLGASGTQIQADRLDAARELAKRFNALVILKGSGTVIAQSNGDIIINTTGNPALATAGTGDVLAGLCGALLSQHWPLREAALGAVWLHGTAADLMVAQGIGPIGITAGELIPFLRSALNRLTKDFAHQRFAH